MGAEEDRGAVERGCSNSRRDHIEAPQESGPAFEEVDDEELLAIEAAVKAAMKLIDRWGYLPEVLTGPNPNPTS